MRLAITALILAGALTMQSCARLTLAWADLKPAGPPATPPALAAFGDDAPVSSVDDWEARRPALLAAFAEHVYGAQPDRYELTVLEKRVLDEAAFGGGTRLVEYKLQADLEFNGSVNRTDVFYLDVAEPADRSGAPAILMETFCPRWDTIPHPRVHRPPESESCGDAGFMSGVMTYVFGRYIAEPPIAEINARGYAVATIFPSEFAPDSKDVGADALRRLSAGLAADRPRWGAVAAWAWGFSAMVDALSAEEGARDFIAYGHSRYGKSALLAAAIDPRIDAAIAHQSGTGGASLSRDKPGETIKLITDSYPHWFTPNYRDYAGNEAALPVDQHLLLALIAPRPVLLGNARRDVWSDPNGAFRAAIGADPVYELYGSAGLDQERLDDWRPGEDLAFWIRPGTHGVVEEDWPAFLEFLDAHFDGNSSFARTR